MFFVLLSLIVFAEAAFKVVPHANVTAFRRVGSLTDGAGHAHMHVSFNVTDDVRVAEDVLTSCQFAANNGTEFLWRPYLAELSPIVRGWGSFGGAITELCNDDGVLGRREKRQAAVLLGATVVSAVGIGAWSLHETRVLSDRVNGIDGAVNHMLVSAKSSLAAEKGLAEDVTSLRAGLSNLTNVVGGLADFEMEYGAACSIKHRLATRLVALKGLLRHHLPAELLEDEDLRKAFRALQRRVEAAGFRLVVSNPLQLLSQQVSFSIKEGIIDVWIHLPVLPKDQPPALLFQHLPLPVERGGAVDIISGEEAFLAYFKEANDFVSLTAADLEACYVSGLDFSCAAAFPRIRGGSKACLPALYEQRLDDAADTCVVTPLRQEEAVFRLNATAFVLATREPRQVDIRCGLDPKEQAAEVRGVALLEMEDGCVATTSSIRFTARRPHLPEDLHVTIQGPSLKVFNATVTSASHFRPTIAVTNHTASVESELAAAQQELAEGEQAETEAGEESATSWLPSWQAWGSWAATGLTFLGFLGVFLCLGKSQAGCVLRHLCARHAGAAAAAQAADAVARLVDPAPPAAARAEPCAARAALATPAAAAPVSVTVNTSSRADLVRPEECVRASPSREDSAHARACSAANPADTVLDGLHPEAVVFRLI